MLSTRTLVIKAFLIASLCFAPGRISCQELTVIDTSEYLPVILEGALENNLMVAASKGYVREIERLIAKGADIDAESSEGATPLIYAVANNRLNSVLTLLAHNPDVNKFTSRNENPLIISVKNQNPEITEALIRGGADIDLADKYGATPLHYAVLNNSFKVTDLLLYYEADCNKKAKDGTTPLMAAILSGYADIADLLFQNGANLEARDNAGFTPLLIAAQNGDTLIMDLLLKEGVDLYEKNNYNQNALTLAIESDQKAAVEMLLDKGDKWSSSGKGAMDPYRVASSFGRKDIIGILEEKKISGRQGLRIDEITIAASAKFNVREYFTGLSVSLTEPLINAGFVAGFDLKPVYTKVLIKNNENTFYQYFDKSSLIFGGIFKEFPISEPSPGTKFTFSASLSAGYSFGSKFKGTNITSENALKIIPAAGIKFQKGHFTCKTDFEYLSTEFYHIGPIWLRIGFAYNYFLSKLRPQGKAIKWY